MGALSSTPYDILGAKKTDNDYQLRLAYRARIHEYKKDRLQNPTNRNVAAENFRLICRAYETLSDHDKRKKYDQDEEWIRNIPLNEYTLQQLAAEPELAKQFKIRLQNVTLRDINAQDSRTGHTALYCAARACNVEAVNYLTEQGAEPDRKQWGGSTALHVSAFYGHPEIVRCLLESGADYRIKNRGKSTAEDESSDADVKQMFTDLKTTPFVQAAADQLDWFKTNISNITQHIDEQYHVQRQTLLHCASKKGYMDLVCWLVEKRSANLDIVDINSNSALHLVAYGGHESVVEYLLNRGANPLLLNKWCMTAEQEGFIHDKKITDLFQSMREQDMFDMAVKGIDWWFEYYFGDKSPDTVNDKGINLLYLACRYGQTLVAKCLLEKGANVNIRLLKESESTPLHGAVYHGHVSTVDLLLSYGADVNIKNKYGSTPIDDARTDEMRQILKQYRANLDGNKFFSVYLFGDGAQSGNEPLAKLQLHYDATYNDLVQAMPNTIRDKYPNFSIARRPLNFEEDNTTVLSAVCRARYGKTKFVQLPLCITAHERARYTHSGHVLSKKLPNHPMRSVDSKFRAKCQSSSIEIRGQLNENQKFTFEDLSFTFPNNCTNENLSINIDYIISPEFDLFSLPECICLFKTQYHGKNAKLNDMPIVSFNGEPNARLYNWVPSSSYWYSYRTRQTRLVSIGETHAFVRHIDIIPSLLSLPPDMFIQAAFGKLFEDRNEPVYCRCLKIREHNKEDFPHIAYHGTNVKAIESILMDGLVMPSTVVSCGLRISPPNNHIARQKTAFGIVDFSNGIFVTPSIHYCSDPAYAVTFAHNDECLISVLECSLKDGSFKSFKSTVPSYVAHEGDDINAIEWRLTNPADIEIISVLFIPVIISKTEAANSRAKKLGADPKC
ncbi:unnamed protein product [Rotaria sordida]|uniref:J domain-containing protein n=1 Tax=Rotaria sordida TaxID=392033 RepID=A0A815S6P7_9BILA|nr:unnamed protein product [Rotaria sordida]CAF1649928.1 unnamed protein product [Rotaria sordida]